MPAERPRRPAPGWRTSPPTSQARAGIEENAGSPIQAKLALGKMGEVPDGGLHPAADVERFAVPARPQQHGRTQEGADRHRRCRENRARCPARRRAAGAARRPRPPAWESGASDPRAVRRPSRASGSRSAVRDACPKSTRVRPRRSWSPHSGCWAPAPGSPRAPRHARRTPTSCPHGCSNAVPRRMSSSISSCLKSTLVWYIRSTSCSNE